MHRRSLPIANPCHEDFGAMEQLGPRRLCNNCNNSVHDLSAMTRTEAEFFLVRHAGQRVCVRYHTRSDGLLRFRSPPPRTTAPMLMALAGLMAACTGYIEAAELTIPEGPTCEDLDGYSIPCIEGDDGIEREEFVEPVEPEGPTAEVFVDEPLMGDIVAPEITAVPPDIEPGYQIEIREPPDDELAAHLPGPLILMGTTMLESERKLSRRSKRETRREQRRERRLARR